MKPPEKLCVGKTFPTHKIHTITHETGNSSSVLFYHLDPEWPEQVPQIKAEGWQITDPNESIQNILDDLEEDNAYPDAIVVLTSASTKVLQDMTKRTKYRFVDGIIH